MEKERYNKIMEETNNKIKIINNKIIQKIQ